MSNSFIYSWNFATWLRSHNISVIWIMWILAISSAELYSASEHNFSNSSEFSSFHIEILRNDAFHEKICYIFHILKKLIIHKIVFSLLVIKNWISYLFMKWSCHYWETECFCWNFAFGGWFISLIKKYSAKIISFDKKV